jgi:hypothetical protein
VDPDIVYIAIPGAVALGALTALGYYFKKRSSGPKPPKT